MSAEPEFYYDTLSKDDFFTMADAVYVLRFSARRILFLRERGYIRGSKLSACTVERRSISYYRFLRKDISKMNDIMGALGLHFNAGQNTRWQRLMTALGETTEGQNAQGGIKIEDDATNPAGAVDCSRAPLTVKEAKVELGLSFERVNELIGLGHLTGIQHRRPIGWRLDADSVERVKAALNRRRLLGRTSWEELLRAIEDAQS